MGNPSEFEPGDVDDAIARHQRAKEENRKRRAAVGRLIKKFICDDCAKVDELDATWFPRAGARFDPTQGYPCARCKGPNVRVLLHP